MKPLLRAYSKFLDFLEIIEKAAIAVSFALMIIFMTYQVILRYVFNHSNVWSEELVRYLFILVVMLAAAIAIRRNSHLQIDVLISLFGPKLKSVFTIVATVVGIGFLGLLCKYSVDLVITGMNTATAGLKISMAIPYAAVPLGCVLMILTSIEVILKNIDTIRGGKEGEQL